MDVKRCTAGTKSTTRWHVVLVLAAAAAREPGSSNGRASPLVAHRAARLPIRFEANAGQWDPRVRFVARGAGPVFFTDDGVTIGGDAPVTLALVGAAPSVPHGEDELVTKSNFFIGNEPARWRTNVPSYARIRSCGVVPGVDVVWHAEEQGLEYDLVVSAGVDARALALEIAGASSSDVTPEGALEIATRAGTLLQQPPRVTQSGHTLRARFVQRDATHFGFTIDGYDAREPVLIDPVLSYSTYLGGALYLGASGTTEGFATAVDASGSVYVVGLAYSTDFPTVQPFQAANAGSDDVFVCKLDASGSALVYSTYLGGSSNDTGSGIAIDASGDVYLTGTTLSTDFPTYNAFQSSGGGTANDAFVTELDASGAALVYSSYLGGSAADTATGIAVDASGTAYVTGYTASTDFPTTGNAVQSANAGGNDAFVSEVSAGGALAYSTYIGGSANDDAEAIAADGAGNAYVIGTTYSIDYPTTQSAFQSANAGYTNVFVTKLNASSASLVYSTYLGGTSYDTARAVVVDPSSNVYVAGYTSSTDFPTQAALQSTWGGAYDCFVSKLNASGSGLVYSTFLGGNNDDYGSGLAVDALGDVYVAGYTSSSDFPLVSPMQLKLAGGEDAFVAVLDAVGTGLVYSTYIGGSANDRGEAIAVDSSGDVYVTGWSASTDFPTQDALQPSLAGSMDAFIAKIVTPALASSTPCTVAGECASNLCVDGVCCNSACTDQCEACDVSGQVGSCTAVRGSPHGGRQTCGGSGVCGGSCDGAHAACTYPTAAIACGSVCMNASEVDSVCSGDGGCVAKPAFSCNDFACANGSRCDTSCATSTDCSGGTECFNGTCGPPPVCVNDHRSQRSDGTTADCTPFACGPSGLCNATCASTNDCVAGWVCTGGTCVLPPYPSGCSVGSSHESPRWLAVFIALLSAMRFRRIARRVLLPSAMSRGDGKALLPFLAGRLLGVWSTVRARGWLFGRGSVVLRCAERERRGGRDVIALRSSRCRLGFGGVHPVAVVVSMDGPTGMGSGCKFQVTWTCGGTAYRIGGGCGPPGDEPDGGYYGVCVDNGTQTSTFDFSTMTCDCKDPQALATLVQAKCLSQ